MEVAREYALGAAVSAYEAAKHSDETFGVEGIVPLAEAFYAFLVNAPKAE